MTTISTARTDVLIPLAPPRARPVVRRKAIAPPRLTSLKQWIRRWLPGITSPRKALADLADGYDSMARRCAARGDVAGACRYRLCAHAIREQLGQR